MHDLTFLRSQSKLDKLKKLYQASSIQSCFIAVSERLHIKMTETTLKRRLDTKMWTVTTLEVIFVPYYPLCKKMVLVLENCFEDR